MNRVSSQAGGALRLGGAAGEARAQGGGGRWRGRRQEEGGGERLELRRSTLEDGEEKNVGLPDASTMLFGQGGSKLRHSCPVQYCWTGLGPRIGHWRKDLPACVVAGCTASYSFAAQAGILAYRQYRAAAAHYANNCSNVAN